jgi:hypothetical protein
MLDQPSIFESIKTHVPFLATLGSALATVVGAISAIVAKAAAQRYGDRRLSELKKETTITVNGIAVGGNAGKALLGDAQEIEVSDGKRQPEFAKKAAPIRARVIIVRQDVERFLEEQISRKKKSSLASNTLTVGQYIIGGLLASSFVSQYMNPVVTGSLGVLVLLSSLIKQNFSPDIDASDAKRKEAQLLELIRETDNELSILDSKIASGEDQTDAMIALLRATSKQLSDIETAEIVKPAPKGVSEPPKTKSLPADSPL